MIRTELTGSKINITGEPIEASVIYDCGQCFRFDPVDDGIFKGIVQGRILYSKTEGDTFTVWPVSPEDTGFIRSFYDLDFDYTEADKKLCSDEVLRKAIPFSRGMRILRQDPFETIISFIISANNNIKRIKGIINRLCEKCGDRISSSDYAFPSPSSLASLTENEIFQCGTGYRAPYIYRTVRDILDGFPVNELYSLDYPDARKILMSLMGIGPKVADCILLFSFGKREAFPKDTWIKKVLLSLYGFEPKNDRDLTEFVKNTFPEFAGLAQQYLFNYARQNGII